MHPQYNNGQPIKQVIVPKKLRSAVMQQVHDSVLSGHLGAWKSTDRILSYFFWPDIHDDVTRFCQSCDICQKTVKKGSVQRVPVQQTPLIDTPFKRCTVDLIGPIHLPSEKGHRYILTLVDYATRYPEAVPLKEISSECVAEALMDIYSRVGIPEGVISDQGRQFASDYMQEFSRLIGGKQLPIATYHAMANGLVERFNGTLKSMLEKLCHKEPRQWHRYINSALFAYREIPQESTGFSPFELLYGRTVQGPMYILRQLWTQEDADAETKTRYQHVLDLRSRLDDTMEVAQRALEENQRRYKKYFDKKAKKREFTSGDKVLILLPTNTNKLLMQWKGLYTVKDKVGVNEYNIKIDSKNRTYHANMLKKYYARDGDADQAKLTAGLADIVEVGGVELVQDSDTPDEEEEELNTYKPGELMKYLHVGKELSTEQKTQLMEMVKQYPEIFTDQPGKTTLIEHTINLTEDEPIRSKPYTLPPGYSGDHLTRTARDHRLLFEL